MSSLVTARIISRLFTIIYGIWWQAHILNQEIDHIHLKDSLAFLLLHCLIVFFG